MRLAANVKRAPAVRWLLPVMLCLLSACASVDPYSAPPITQRLERDDDIGYCARLFADIDRRIDLLGVRDAEAVRVAGFPYLRVDRFTAALGEQAKSPAEQSAWHTRLRRLDEAARGSELANAALPGDDLARCRDLLAAADVSEFSEIRARAEVPDDYSLALRTLGLYPLTRLPFAAGIADWHTDTRSIFATPIDKLPVQGALARYQVAHREMQPLAAPTRDALGVPVWRNAQIEALFVRHAPVLEIDVAGPYDRPGALVLDAEDRVAVNTKVPVVYTRLTHTLIGGLIHPQLVYTFWFSERPSRNVFDLLAGKLDGVVWRVTLDSTGDVLVYDSMHACGCYHMFFPTSRVRARQQPATLDEGLFVPQAVRAPAAGEKTVLRIASGTHYLQRVQIESAARSGSESAAASYALQDERALTMLARRVGGTRSAYDEHGLIEGSERAERWLFWPMGIESAGQMRQWGRHATAFIGRRHFDDPRLFDAYFEVRRCDDCAPH